ncbi:Succinate-semialdehyde dehydrogenase GabD [Diplonema papillatum]|nr:Succinate-semialdehyde dehydrogenase GabD [Diplonema papillatum]KAJ9460702.1 Succinate-semialdehyde dehydrogenase GabD [Diplonema papillatum]
MLCRSLRAGVAYFASHPSAGAVRRFAATPAALHAMPDGAAMRLRDEAASAGYAPVAPPMVVGGKAITREHRASFAVTNPATGEVVGWCPEATSEDVDAAVDAAQAALDGWSGMSLDDRRACVAEAVGVLAVHAQELADIITKEQGKPRGGESADRAAVGAHGEIQYCIDLARDAMRLDPKERVVGETEGHTLLVRRKPVGVVAGISPWNYPLGTLLQKLFPAVVLGNTFIAKPSPYTPLSPLRCIELLAPCFPSGVVGCVVSDDRKPDAFSAGRHLTCHPGVRKVSFTGSEQTGIAIMAECARDVKRVTLELGGNDAAIVCADVPVKETAEQVFAAAFDNSGQVCCALKRCYVHASIHDEFVKELCEVAGRARFGDGMLPSTDYGPLNNEMQLKKVEAMVADARARGGRVLVGGKRREGPGYFYDATIVSEVAEGVQLVDEEQFGPVLPVIRFEDEEDAVRQANALRFGLGGSVWSADKKRANRLASRLDAGTVWVNEHLGETPGCPFGGFKHSGLGRECGEADLAAYTELQTIKIVKE